MITELSITVCQIAVLRVMSELYRSSIGQLRAL